MKRLILVIFLLTSPLCIADTQRPPTDIAPPGAVVIPQPSTPAGPSENVAKIVLTTPPAAKVGELVRLDASKSNAASYKWLAPTGDFEVIDGGCKAVFSAREPGTYTFTLAVALDGTVDVVTFQIKVEGPLQPPQTDNLGEWVTYWKASMDLPKDKVEALAISFDRVALQMTTLAKPEVIIQETAKANREALGADLDKFVPLLQKIQTALQKMAQSGQLTTPEQHAVVWQDIARGLRS